MQENETEYDNWPSIKNISAVAWILFWSIICLIYVLFATIGYTHSYGWALYIGLPVTIGFIIGFLKKPGGKFKFLTVLSTVFLITLVVSIFLMMLKIEGAICIIMIIVPLYFVLLMGYLLGMLIRKLPNMNRNACLLLLINPTLVAVDANPKMHLQHIDSNIIINAPANKVWQILTQPVAYPANANFFFKYSVNYPQKMYITRHNDSTFLHCDLRNGQSDLWISSLETEKKMHFEMLEPIVPMKEISFYDSVNTAHTRGDYFKMQYGEFELVKLNDRHTLLKAHTQLSFKLAPSTYWKWWCNYLVNQMHRHVLERIKDLSEAPLINI